MAIAREAEPVGSLQADLRKRASTARTSSASTGTCWSRAASRSAATSSTSRARSPARSTRAAGTRARPSAIATAMGPDDVGTPLHRDMGVHITRGVEPWRIFAQVHGPRRRPDAGQGRQRPHGRRAPRPDRDGQPPAGDAARSRSAARSPSGSARRSRVAVGWFGEGVGRARRRARGDEPRRRPPAAGGLHLRQQPVGVLDADAPRLPDREHRRPRPGVRLRRRGRRRHRRARRLPRGEARDREGARRRRADADRVHDAAHGGPRRPRRRLLRAQGHVRGVGEERPDRALPDLAARERRLLATRRRTRSPPTSRSS